MTSESAGAGSCPSLRSKLALAPFPEKRQMKHGNEEAELQEAPAAPIRQKRLFVFTKSGSQRSSCPMGEALSLQQAADKQIMEARVLPGS